MKKRKTDLFRFITLRSPETIAQDKKDLGFVKPDFDYGESHFLAEVIPGDLSGSRENVLDMIPVFSGFDDVAFLKDTYTAQWDFALWLTKNKNKLVRSELDTLVPTALTGASWVSLWDNMYYHILTGKNPYIQQACIQMIVANNFIGEEFCRLGIAKIQWASEFCTVTTVCDGKKGTFWFKDGLFESMELESAENESHSMYFEMKMDPLFFGELQFNEKGLNELLNLLREKFSGLTLEISRT